MIDRPVFPSLPLAALIVAVVAAAAACPKPTAPKAVVEADAGLAPELQQKLDEALAGHGCPPGAKKVGAEPPAGSELWCEKAPGGEGARHGRYRKWHDDGRKAVEGDYVDGAQDGVWTEWYPDGQRKSETPYKAGVPHGRWRTWSETGELTSDVNYVDGAAQRRAPGP